MSKKHIRMPWGAALACILVTALVITGIITAGKYIASRPKAPVDVNASASPSPEADDDSSVSPNAPQTTPKPNDVISHSENAMHNNSETDSKYEMIDHAMSSVVSIDVTMKTGFTSILAGSGSGVIVSEDGYILTCNHVIEGADKVYVYLNDGREYEAEIIGFDGITDLAVVKINASGLPFATLGNSSTLRIGEGVYAIGNALGELSNTYTSGSISGLDRTIEIEGQRMNLLQTDAAINKGNSGGGLFRASDGTLIGIVNAKNCGNGIEGLGFAIPSDLVFKVSQDLIQYGFVTGRPYLGISTQDVRLGVGGLFGNYYTYPRVTFIDSGSPAEKCGFRINDIILAIDGTSVSGTDSLVQLINQYNIGDEITVTVQRGNSNVDLKVVLAERQSAAD